jgi:hypothetical protein
MPLPRPAAVPCCSATVTVTVSLAACRCPCSQAKSSNPPPTLAGVIWADGSSAKQISLGAARPLSRHNCSRVVLASSVHPSCAVYCYLDPNFDGLLLFLLQSLTTSYQSRPVESTQDKTTKQNKTNLQARDSSPRRDRHLLRSPTLPDRPKPTDLSRQLLASSPAPCASSAHHPNSLAAPFILSACARRLHALHPRRRCSCDDAASSLASPSHHPSPSSPRSRRLALPCLAAYLDVWTSQPPMLTPATA